MDPTAPVIVTCRNKVFLAERVLIQRRECFDVPETWFYSIMKDWTPIPLRSPSVVQGEDCEDFNIPALISLVIKCYEVSRTMQATANQNTGSSAKPNLEGLKIPAPWSSGTNTIFICCKPIFWGLTSFFYFMYHMYGTVQSVYRISIGSVISGTLATGISNFVSNLFSTNTFLLYNEIYYSIYQKYVHGKSKFDQVITVSYLIVI